MGEIKKGIYKLPNSEKKDKLEKWLFQLEKRFRNRIIPIDLEISIQWGQTQEELEQKGKSMPSIDALIASTAMAKNLIIITHNAKDMKHSRAQILDPWD